MREIEQVII